MNGVQSSAGHLVHFCVSGYSYTTTISGEFRHDFPADQSQPYSLQAGRRIRAPQVCPALLGDLRGAAGFHAFVYAPQKRVPRVKTFPPSNHTATKVLTNACDWLPRCHLGGGGPAPGLVRTPTCSHVTKSSQGALGAQERQFCFFPMGLHLFRQPVAWTSPAGGATDLERGSCTQRPAHWL